ncbi:MAG: serine hydrolase [Cyanobacteria bacterium QS_8_64_29]|nr:MAG: serine hydrolase [Cyanobacteria bacterium QS_8_64_29]
MPFFRRDAALVPLGTDIIARARAEFASLTADRLALSWLIADGDPPLRSFSHRGREPIYPASLIKLFYATAIQQWLQQDRLAPSAELERALRDALGPSSNDATSLLVDLLTDTTSGPDLPPEAFEQWQWQRNRINRYFGSFGWPALAGTNLNQKTWSDGPYGRERTFVGRNLENRNRLTTDATARLLYCIASGMAVSPQRAQHLRALLARSLDPSERTQHDGEDQVSGFLGEGLPAGARLYAKGGWTSHVRHDAAYIELPGCPPYVLVAFTEGTDLDRGILPFVSSAVAAAMGELAQR